MLPFMKNKLEGSVSAPPEVLKRESDDEDQEFDSLEVAAEDLCNAIHSKDYKAIAAALRAAIDLAGESNG